MQINLFATFRLNAGFKHLDLDLPAGVTIHQAVVEIATQHPILRKDWLDENDQIHAHVHIFLNGVDYATLPLGQDTPLQPTDSLDFFPPVAGG
jgi:molybdopterin synthase sulfur carrier subunit